MPISRGCATRPNMLIRKRNVSLDFLSVRSKLRDTFPERRAGAATQNGGLASTDGDRRACQAGTGLTSAPTQSKTPGTATMPPLDDLLLPPVAMS
jgi:hypothetical protein